MTHIKVQVAIFGDGPAGSTVALILAKHGIPVVLVGKANKSFVNMGESLPPNIKPFLQSLGLWQQFLEDNHLPSYGNRSIWGDINIQNKDFIFNPYGYGWHLDRFKFDRMLINAASKKGAVYIKSNGSILDNGHNDHWYIHITTDKGHTECIDTNILVDATGRLNYIARKKRIRRIIYDHLIGIIAILYSEHPDSDYMSLIESVKYGWWYSAKISKNSRIAVFFTHSNLPIAKYARTTLGWKKLLQNTIQIRNSIESNHYELRSEPYIVAANSSKLEKMIGKDWIAVGDAAAAYDPLSSQGIMLAIGTGIGAANAILWYLNGKTSALDKYEEKLNQFFYEYLEKRFAYYNKERRWTDSIFWEQSKRLII
jgi:flavin-dependent dehydrogenase